MENGQAHEPIAYTTEFDIRCLKYGATGVMFSSGEEGDIPLCIMPTPSAIEAWAALIANGLLGQASEEDVREVELKIYELLGVKS